MNGYNYLILPNITSFNGEFFLDGNAIEVVSGFRGFDCVTPGRHLLTCQQESQPALSLAIDMAPYEAKICYVKYEERVATELVVLDDSEPNRYYQVALGGGMGFTLRTYPGAWKTVRDRSVIEDIFSRRGRLAFLLKNNYGLTENNIQSLRVAANVVEFGAATRNFSFKLCPYAGDAFNLYVFVPDTDPKFPNSYEQKLDPALWQVLNEMIYDWAEPHLPKPSQEDVLNHIQKWYGQSDA